MSDEAFLFQGGYVASVSNALAFGIGTVADVMDQHGHAWTSSGGNIAVIDDTGTILQSYVAGTIATDIVNFANANGASIPAPGASDNGFCLGVVGYDGIRYILVFQHKYMNTGLLFYDILAVMTANVDGTYTVLGAAWTIGATAFETRCYKLDLAGTKTDGDYVMAQLGGFTGDYLFPFWVAFPSIADIIANVASGFSARRYVISNGPSFNAGTQYHGWGLPAMDAGLGINAGGCDQASFTMPDGAGGTIICTYLNKTCMDSVLVPAVADYATPYPNGILTVAPVTIVAPTFGAPVMGADIGYTIASAPGSFVDGSGTPYDCFTDVHKNADGSAGSSDNDYYPVPRIIERITGGFLVGWYQPYFTDTSYLGSTAWTLKEKLRVMNWSTAGQTYTDNSLLEGNTVPITDLGGSASQPQDFVDINGWGVWLDGGQLNLWHMNGPSATGSGRYVTWLGSIGLEPTPFQGNVQIRYKTPLETAWA